MCYRPKKQQKQAYNSGFLVFLLPQYPQPTYMPASSLLFSGTLTCIFAFIPGDHQGSVGTSGGQKKAKNGAKLHVLG